MKKPPILKHIIHSFDPDRLTISDPVLQNFCIQKIGFFKNFPDHGIRRNKGLSESILIYCLEGKGSLSIRKKTWQISAGDVFVIPKDAPHAYYSDRGQPWTIHWTHVVGRSHFEILRLLGVTNLDPVVSIGYSSSLILAFEKSYEAYLDDESLSAKRLGSSILQQALCQLSFDLNSNRITNDKLIKDLILYLAQELNSPLTLEQMADYVQLSKYHFLRRFKNVFHQTPNQYFTAMKMQRAVFLLETSALSIKEISFQLGYDDPYYFSRIFKKISGLSPKIFRIQYQEKQ